MFRFFILNQFQYLYIFILIIIKGVKKKSPRLSNRYKYIIKEKIIVVHYARNFSVHAASKNIKVSRTLIRYWSRQYGFS